MKKCPYCAEKIKEEAVKCKHCGSVLNNKQEKDEEKQKKEFSPKRVLIAVIVIILVIIAIAASSGGDSSSSGEVQNNADSHRTMAYIQAKNFVKQALKSPGSADFPFFGEGVPLGDNRYKVVSHVDAQNSFGASIRNDWQVIIRYAGGDDADINNWTLEEMIIEGEAIYP